jgi:hypothetical protein
MGEHMGGVNAMGGPPIGIVPKAPRPGVIPVEHDHQRDQPEP